MTDTDTAELVAAFRAYIAACSGPGTTLYDGHPAVLLAKGVEHLTALERERDEARATLARESGDLRYAKQALDRETARAIRFGKELTASQAEVERLKLELEAADRFGGGWFSPLVSEDVKEGYRILVRERDALQPQVGK